MPRLSLICAAVVFAATLAEAKQFDIKSSISEIIEQKNLCLDSAFDKAAFIASMIGF